MEDSSAEKSTYNARDSDALVGDIERSEPSAPLMNSKEDPEKPLTCYQRMRRRPYLSSCLIITIMALAVIVPVFFLVILPDIIQQNVDETDITINSADIILPTNESFSSKVTLQFSKKPPIKSRVAMQDVTISWKSDEEEVDLQESGSDSSRGGELLTLKDSNSIPANTKEHTLYSRGVVKDSQALSNFGVYAMNHDQFTWKMKGKAKVHSFISNTLVDIEKTVNIDGFNSFNISPVVKELNVTGGSTESLHNLVKVKMYSEARVQMILGQDLHFRVKSHGRQIGIGTAPNCTFYIGEFDLDTKVEMMYTNQEEHDELMYVMSQYLMGIDVPLTMEEFYLDNPITWLDAALLSINTSSALPGRDTVMIQSIDLYVNLLNFMKVPFTLVLNNDFDTTMTITKVSATIYYTGKLIATVDENNLNIVLPPKSQTTTPRLSSSTNLKEVSALMDLIKAGAGLFDVYNTIVGRVGDYQLDIIYNQLAIPAFVHKE